MKIFENAVYNVLPISDFRIFKDLNEWSFPAVDSEQGKALIELADKALDEEIPQLYATKFLEFTRNGNRANYEADYFKRRRILKALLLGEIILNSGKYLDKIIDVVWLILEETTWHIPAHNIDRSGNPSVDVQPLGYNYDGSTVSYIDLFSAETGAIMAFVHYFLKEKLDGETPIIGERMVYEIKRRVIKPYLERCDQWWRGYSKTKKPNNWNPWIAANVLTSTALVESELSVRKKIVAQTMESLDFFADIYHEDGGCDEGPSYWLHAGAALYAAAEVIYDMTGGSGDFFENKLLYNMLDYIRKVHLYGFKYANFADCDPELYTGGMHSAIRMGIRTGNKALYNFASSNTKKICIPEIKGIIYSDFKDVCFDFSESAEFIPNKFDKLENLQVAVCRNKDGFTLAAKGGHNGESHNHNDVGQFILLNGDIPVIIDIGAPTYTRDVFSKNRYNVFPTNGTWHSVPIINGFAQKEGAEHHCDRFDATEEKITIEYQSAYEKEANVKKCLREIYMGKDAVSIKETIDFDGNEAIFQYYMTDAPIKKEENTLVFENGVKITVPDGCEIVAVPVADKRTIKSWKRERLFKLVIRLEKSGSFELKFERV